MRLVEGRLDDAADVEEFLDRLAAIGDEHGATVQAFDARYVVGREHLEQAVDLADRAFERGGNVARDRSVEILLYAAGRRQIDRALEMGAEPGGPVVVLVEGGDEAAAGAAVQELLEPAAVLGGVDQERVRAFFDVSAAELDATNARLADLVLERVALLEVEK